MLDRYDTTVVLDTWAVPTVGGDGPSAASYVMRFARDQGMDAALVSDTGVVIASAFARAVDLLDGETDHELMAVDAATDGDYLTVRISTDGARGPAGLSLVWSGEHIAIDRRRGRGVAVLVELPMTTRH
jgi:hypothetical protein